jgi:hypothetical protein
VSEIERNKVTTQRIPALGNHLRGLLPKINLTLAFWWRNFEERLNNKKFHLKKLCLSLVLVFLMSVLSAQTDTIINATTLNQFSSIEDKIPDIKAFRKEFVYSINYSPLAGFTLGLWPISANITLSKGFLEWTIIAFARKFEYDRDVISPNATAIYSVAGPRYVFSSKSNTHFFIHGLAGYCYYHESSTIFLKYDASRQGIAFSPGFGIYSYKPSKLGVRLGMDILITPGYSTDVWTESTFWAIQFTLGACGNQ